MKEIGVFGLIGNIPGLLQATSVKEEEQLILLAGPYLQQIEFPVYKVCCVFNQPCFAWLELVDDQGNVLQKIYEEYDGMRQANTDKFQFICKVDHHVVNYRIAAKEIKQFDPYKIEYGKEWKGEIHSVETAAEDVVEHRVLILNDIHEQPDSYRELYEMSALKNPHLVLINGDSFHYVTTQQDLVDKLLKPVTDVFATKVPFIMVRGNHETRGKFARDFKSYFAYPDDKFYQAFRMGSVFWIVLDGGEDKPDSHEVYAGTVDYDAYRLAQRAWLKEVLASQAFKDARFRIVVNHIPFFHSDEWHGTLHNRECFHDLLNEARVNAVISGHTHDYGFYPPNNEHAYHVIIGGGPKVGTRAFVEVKSTKDDLSIILKKDDGTTLGKL